LASVTDPHNSQITFTYDFLSRLATWTDANGAVESVNQRSGTGYVLSSTDRKGQVTTFTYDALNRPATVTYADNSVLTLTWDLGGRLTNVQDSIGGAIARSYDNLISC
jgi:YD repeat-containing protein